jgi:hypothetical protein
MPHGTCKLCLEHKELQDSHLYPRALYKALMNEDGGNRNPVLLTSTTLVQKSGHLTEYVLCRECEQHFNRYGENWVSRYAFNGKSFPLRDILLASTPAVATEDDKLVPYAGAHIDNIDMDQLIFFGLSLFWRASVHTWNILDGEVHLPLGDHEEALRLCLLGKAAMPGDVAMNVIVSNHKDPWRSFLAIGPSAEQEKRYLIMIAGLHFMLVVGSPHYGDYQWSSTHSSERYIFTSRSLDFLNAYGTLSTILRQKGLDSKWDVFVKL